MKTSKTVVAVLFLFAAAMVSVADLALAWIAAGAKREGLRLRRGVNLLQSSTPRQSSCTMPTIWSGASGTGPGASETSGWGQDKGVFWGEAKEGTTKWVNVY